MVGIDPQQTERNRGCQSLNSQKYINMKNAKIADVDHGIFVGQKITKQTRISNAQTVEKNSM